MCSRPCCQKGRCRSKPLAPGAVHRAPEKRPANPPFKIAICHHASRADSILPLNRILVSAMDDEGDFKKARGFLLTYSALVLALVYFGADLTQFKLMGNEIKLHQRTESAWLVLAMVNIYFWFRCYQRVPRLGLYFDTPMNDLYDKILVWNAVKLKRWTLKKLGKEQIGRQDIPSLKIQSMFITGEATGRSTQEEDQRTHGDEAPELYQLSRTSRTKMLIKARFVIAENSLWGSNRNLYDRLNYEPSAFITWPIKAFVIVRGAFVTPWFTDHIAPLVLGGVSTILALWKWADINFLSTTAPHIALQCVG